MDGIEIDSDLFYYIKYNKLKQIKLQKMEKNRLQRAKTVEQKNNHPLNKSRSKAQYSFSKSERFPRRKYRSVTDIRFYDVKDNSHKPNVSFGSSQRVDFCKKDGVPPSTYYDTINKLTSDKNGIKFKAGRDECKHNSAFKTDQNPGPGKYESNSDFKYKKINYSIGKRFKTTIPNEESVPGPKYNIPSTLMDKDKFLSIYVRRNSTKIYNPVSNVFKGNQKLKEHNMETTLKTPQQSRIITHKGKKSFGWNGPHVLIKPQDTKRPQQKSSGPGPGSYSSFSEF